MTAHKVALFESARDELDDVDALAMLCREISVLRREGSRLIGCAIEPRSIALTLQRMVPPGHWTATGGELLIFGAGGTAAALLASFYSRVAQGPDAPSTVHLVDTRSARANALRDSVLRWRPAVSVITADAGRSAEVVAGLPPGSLIVNATGLGKDTPGSPVPLPARWPQKAVFWDLNYRGDLPMLADARQAAERRSLRVYDGWTLFIEGWAEALGLIFGRRSTAEDRAILERAALSVQS